jgi:hypothetical protein
MADVGSNLTVLRLKLREATNEICPELISWPDDLVDGFIHRAVEEFSRWLPHQKREMVKSSVTCHRVNDEDNVITASNATDLKSLKALLIEAKGDYNLHVADTLTFYHKHTDTKNATTANIPFPPGTLEDAIVLANDLKEKFNNHRTEPKVHYSSDRVNAVPLADSRDLDGAIKVANEFKKKYNKHLSQKTDGREVCLESLTHVMTIQGVEYPVGRFPQCFVPFEVPPLTEDSLLLLTDNPPRKSEEDIRIYYDAFHLIDIFLSTIPLGLEPLILDAAIAFICFGEAYAHLKLAGLRDEEAAALEAKTNLEIEKADIWQGLAGVTLAEAKILAGDIFTDVSADLYNVADRYVNISIADQGDASVQLAIEREALNRAGHSMQLADRYYKIGTDFYNRFRSSLANDISELPIGDRGQMKFRQKVAEVRAHRFIIPSKPYIFRIC